MATRSGKSPYDSRVAFTASIDAASGLALPAYTPWIRNEFKPADKVAVQYSSEDTVKVLLAVGEGGDLRARGSNVLVGDSCPRIITANAVSPEVWLGEAIPWSKPLQRKCIVFVLTEPVAVPSWSDKFKKAKGFEPADIDYKSAIVRSALFSAEQLTAPEQSAVMPAQPSMSTAAAVGTALAVGASLLVDQAVAILK